MSPSSPTTTSVDSTIDGQQEARVEAEPPTGVSVHIGGCGELVSNIHKHTSDGKHLIMAPVDLHKRNFEHRLRDLNTSTECISVTGVVDVAESLVSDTSGTPVNLDRIDRLSLLRELLDSQNEISTLLTRVRGVDASADVVEHLRSEVESVTNYHPSRVESWREGSEKLSNPVVQDVHDLLDISIRVQHELGSMTSKAISDVELLRKATRDIAILRSDWSEVYPDVTHVSLVGVSSLTAPHMDLLNVLATETSLTLDVYCRRGTGAYHMERVSPVLDVSTPGAVIPEVRR